MLQQAASASAELRPTPNFVELEIKAQECLERIERMQELLDIIYANKHSATEGLSQKGKQNMPDQPYPQAPAYMNGEILEWLKSLRDENGVTSFALKAIIQNAEEDYDKYMGGQATEKGREEARYIYMLMAGLSEEFADSYRSGIQD